MKRRISVLLLAGMLLLLTACTGVVRPPVLGMPALTGRIL